MTGEGLFDLVRPAFAAHASDPALEIEDRAWSYAEFGALAASVAEALAGETERDPVAIFASRSLTAYCGILGSLAAGRGFVPLNPDWPLDRLRGMLTRSRARGIVVEPACLDDLPELLDGVPACNRVVVPETVVDEGVRGKLKGMDVRDAGDLDGAVPLPEASPAGIDDVAYLLFTSGTTGEPKGVPVRHRNIRAYLRAIQPSGALGAGDRCSHFFDLTFDPSVHDIFLAWMGGACLCVVPKHAKLAPARFIREKRLTTWHSVPSVILLLDRLGQLKADSFPDLRLSRFAGEALPLAGVEAWSAAAPNSVIENLYGPTECAVNVTRHRWSRGDPSRNGVVPIGRALSGVESILQDDRGDVVRGAGQGELLVSGEQVTGSYLDDPEESSRRFVRLPDRGQTIYYRTGDVVERDPDGVLFYAGRIDEQIQVRGNRVELQEVDAALRAITGASVAVAVPWPYGALRAEGLFAFVPAECALPTGEIRGALRARLPSYMVPEKIFRIDDFPLNRNGKLDRRALATLAGTMTDSR